MKYFFSGLVLFVFIFTTVVAPVAAATQQENMIIKTIVGGDEMPPTTPTNLQLLPVSSAEIILTFDPAIDNTAIGGYRILRDEVFIATTTLTTFNDTGLLPETLYSYTVEAFDIFFNVSSTSEAVATSTLAIPVPPPPDPAPVDSSSANAGTLLLLPNTFSIVTDTNSARLSWQTGRITQYTVRWGRTTSYELGTITNGQWKQKHETVISGLASGTKYYYEVLVTDRLGMNFVISEGSFSTRGLVPPAITPNVSQVRAVVTGADVALSWVNPPGEWSTIRVVRNHFFFPTNPQDGFLVYEGMGQSVTDMGALSERSPQYYTIFVYGSDGSVSSGSVIRVTRAIAVSDDSLPDIVIPDDTRPPILLPDETATPHITVTALDVFLVQDTVVTTLARPENLRADLPTYVYIPIEAVPPHLKAIVLSVTNPSQQTESASYLLKINPDGTRYEALIPAMVTTGESQFTIELYDFELETVRTIQNKVMFGYQLELIDWSPVILMLGLGSLFFVLIWILIARFWVRRA